MNNEETLDQLSGDHPLRNSPLGQIGAECANLNTKFRLRWDQVKDWKIRNVTYNQLAPVWTDHCLFRIPPPPQTK